jgi:hypothetical protein
MRVHFRVILFHQLRSLRARIVYYFNARARDIRLTPLRILLSDYS